MKALTAAEMREVDRLTIEQHGVSGLQLMENAGSHVAHRIAKCFSPWPWDRRPRVVILCGKGNNGGDGFVIARQLQAGPRKTDIRVFLFAKQRELKGDALKNAQRWKKSGGTLSQVLTEAEWIRTLHEVSAADVVIDALFGTGLRGP